MAIVRRRYIYSPRGLSVAMKVGLHDDTPLMALQAWPWGCWPSTWPKNRKSSRNSRNRTVAIVVKSHTYWSCGPPMAMRLETHDDRPLMSLQSWPCRHLTLTWPKKCKNTQNCNSSKVAIVTKGHIYSFHGPPMALRLEGRNDEPLMALLAWPRKYWPFKCPKIRKYRQKFPKRVWLPLWTAEERVVLAGPYFGRLLALPLPLHGPGCAGREPWPSHLV